MVSKLLTWPLAFAVASLVMVAASAAGWSTGATAIALAVSLVAFVAIAVPLTEGVGQRAQGRPPRRAR